MQNMVNGGDLRKKANSDFKVGPVFRISPRELSIKDPEFYSELFVAGSTRRSEKWKPAVTGLRFESKYFPSREKTIQTPDKYVRIT
jgi:hypothetical protein